MAKKFNEPTADQQNKINDLIFGGELDQARELCLGANFPLCLKNVDAPLPESVFNLSGVKVTNCTFTLVERENYSGIVHLLCDGTTFTSCDFFTEEAGPYAASLNFIIGDKGLNMSRVSSYVSQVNFWGKEARYMGPLAMRKVNFYEGSKIDFRLPSKLILRSMEVEACRMSFFGPFDEEENREDPLYCDTFIDNCLFERSRLKRVFDRAKITKTDVRLCEIFSEERLPTPAQSEGVHVFCCSQRPPEAWNH